MNKETLLIIKIIIINLIVGFILVAFLSSKAQGPIPSWDKDVHIKITGLSPENKATAINYVQSRIDPLDLDTKLIFDDNLLAANGINKEGIDIRYAVSGVQDCYGTRVVRGFDNNGNAYTVQKILIGTDCLGGRPDINPIYWLNVLLHEFNHALGMGHLKFVPGMPEPLMRANQNTADKLSWTFNDAWNLQRKYSRNKIIRYRRINFKRGDVGKWCYLVKGNKSVSFLIENQSMLVPYLDKLESYRKVIK